MFPHGNSVIYESDDKVFDVEEKGADLVWCSQALKTIDFKRNYNDVKHDI